MVSGEGFSSCVAMGEIQAVKTLPVRRNCRAFIGEESVDAMIAEVVAIGNVVLASCGCRGDSG
jgi:hypothetical protein